MFRAFQLRRGDRDIDWRHRVRLLARRTATKHFEDKQQTQYVPIEIADDGEKVAFGIKRSQSFRLFRDEPWFYGLVREFAQSEFTSIPRRLTALTAHAGPGATTKLAIGDFVFVATGTSKGRSAESTGWAVDSVVMYAVTSEGFDICGEITWDRETTLKIALVPRPPNWIDAGDIVFHPCRKTWWWFDTWSYAEPWELKKHPSEVPVDASGRKLKLTAARSRRKAKRRAR